VKKIKWQGLHPATQNRPDFHPLPKQRRSPYSGRGKSYPPKTLACSTGFLGLRLQKPEPFVAMLKAVVTEKIPSIRVCAPGAVHGETGMPGQNRFHLAAIPFMYTAVRARSGLILE